MSDHDVSKMKVADLKKELKNRGLSTLGNKNELVDRLQGALIDGGDPLEDTAISEDLLEDDELNDDILEEEEDDKQAHETTEEDRILKSPTPSEPSKSESPEQKSSETSIKDAEKKEDQPAAPQKKVALKRNISISVPTPATAAATVTAAGSDDEKKPKADSAPKEGESASDEPDKKVIKLTELSAQQRLEMRAKKFGGGQSNETPDSKLQARAARFGLASSDSSTGGASTKPASSLVGIDALKKRAERFGVSVSDKMTKLEQDEKLIKRQERFGTVTAPTLTATGKVAISSGSTAKTDYAEKARLRLERFKNTA